MYTKKRLDNKIKKTLKKKHLSIVLWKFRNIITE